MIGSGLIVSLTYQACIPWFDKYQNNVDLQNIKISVAYVILIFVQFHKQEVNVDNYISEKNYKNKHLSIMNVLLKAAKHLKKSMNQLISYDSINY